MRKKLSIQQHLIQQMATCFYLGYIPPASGSVASLIGVVIYQVFYHQRLVYLGLTFFITAIGFIVSGKMEAIVGRKDPSCIVIDEVSGMMIALIGLPVDFSILIISFFLFRAFDMFKIYPANIFEKKHGGIGIMMDDIMAGVYTNIIMHVVLLLKTVS